MIFLQNCHIYEFYHKVIRRIKSLLNHLQFLQIQVENLMI